MNGTVWIVAIACAAVLVFGFRWAAKRRAFRGRAPVSLEELHRSVADRVTPEVFAQVFRALGEAYSVDPRLIRPNDSLKTLLNMDSWVLDAGTDKLNQWLAQVGINESSRQPSTVLDLLLLVEGKLSSGTSTSRS